MGGQEPAGDPRRTRVRAEGVSDRGGELLQEAFGVKTVADLAELKYARWAQALAALGATAK